MSYHSHQVCFPLFFISYGKNLEPFVLHSIRYVQVALTGRMRNATVPAFPVNCCQSCVGGSISQTLSLSSHGWCGVWHIATRWRWVGRPDCSSKRKNSSCCYSSSQNPSGSTLELREWGQRQLEAYKLHWPLSCSDVHSARALGCAP